MATYEQRAQAIADAVLNKVATASQKNRLGRAFAYQGGMLSEYDAMTSAAKAAFVVGRIRGYCVSIVKHHDQSVAADQAKVDAGTAVDSEFAEGP